MRKLLFAVCVFVGSIATAGAPLAVSFAAPGISIGINVPTYPCLNPSPVTPSTMPRA